MYLPTTKSLIGSKIINELNIRRLSDVNTLLNKICGVFIGGWVLY